jgi:hypothetical protein
MESGDVLEKSWRKVGAKEVADAMGVSLSLVYKWAAPKEQGGAINPLDRVQKLLECTGDTEMLDWLCRQANGYYLPNPTPAQGEERELLAATQTLVEKFAILLSSIAAAAADSRITPEEAAAIRQVWDALKSHAEGFVRACESGTYRQP